MAFWASRRVLKALSLLCIALALAVTTAVFTIADGLLYRPLPFPDADELAVLSYRPVAGQIPPIAYEIALTPERERLRAAIVESGLVQSSTEVRTSGLFGRDAPRARLHVVEVDTNFFDVFRFAPFRGSVQPRELLRTIDQSTAPVVVLGHGLWQRLGGADIGPATVEGRSVVVAAVLPPGAKFPGETNIWVVGRPLSRPPTHVRLAPGAALSELALRAEALDVRSLGSAMRPEHTEGVIALLLAAALVVLIAWVQLAGLTIADLLARLRDFGVRLSLGATRRQLLVRSALWDGVTALGVGGLAILAVPPAVALLMSYLPAELTHGQYVSIGWRSVAFLVALVAVGFGVLACSPLWVLRLPPLDLLRGRVAGVSLTASRVRRVLLVTQVAVGAALLYVTGLLGHSLSNAVRYDYGFASEDVVLFEPPLPGTAFTDFEERYMEMGRLTRVTVELLYQRPDIVAAAGMYRVPLVRPTRSGDWEAVRSFGGMPMPPGTQIHSTTVGREFTEALGVTVLQGEGFSHRDVSARQNIALVNATFARMFGGEIDAGGRTLQLNVVGKPLETTWFKGTVVGVVQDLVFTKVSDPPVPQVFVLAGPSGTFPYIAFPYIAIRIPGGLDGSQRLKSSLEDVWGPLPADRFVALKDFWDAGLLPYMGQAKLVGMLALFAIPLAVIGVASFMLFVVRSEHRATAIRLAVGAEPRQIMKEVLTKGAVTVAAGVGIGAAVGVGLGRILSARLFGVDALDPASLAVAVVCFGVMGLAASVAPARIAGSANPAGLLRENGD